MVDFGIWCDYDNTYTLNCIVNTNINSKIHIPLEIKKLYDLKINKEHIKQTD